MHGDLGMALEQPQVVLVEPPPELEREFSKEFKKARKKFGKLVEAKVDGALGAERGMGGDKQMNEASRLIEQMKHLEFMP